MSSTNNINTNENVVATNGTQEGVNDKTIKQNPKPKKKFWIIGILAVVVIAALIVGGCFAFNKYRQNSAIESVKQSHLGGYSKTVEEAFNDCFGAENIKWSYDSKSKSVMAQINNDYTTIDLGYSNTITFGWGVTGGPNIITFSYDPQTGEIEDANCVSYIKIDKTGKGGSFGDSLMNSDDGKALLNGIFKEDLDVYKHTLELSKEHDIEKQEKINELQELVDRLNGDNVNKSDIAQARKLIVEKGLLLQDEADKAQFDEIKEILQSDLEASKKIQNSNEFSDMRETTARLAASYPWRVKDER